MNDFKPVVTWTLLAVNIAVFMLTAGKPDEFAGFMLWPVGDNFSWWQIVTHAFMHGSMNHLIFNMFALWQFGSVLERFFGRRFYLTLYFCAVLFAALLQLLVNALMSDATPMLGASGGVFGLLYAFAATFPKARIAILFLPIPMPAWIAMTLYGAAELFFGLTGTFNGVAHFAHIGGIVGAFLLLPLPWRKQLR
jgi:membrane associated rhomboid family serine protease